MKRPRVYSNIYKSTEVGIYDNDSGHLLELCNYMRIGYVPHKLLGWDLSVNELLNFDELRENKKRKLKDRLDNEWEFSIEFQEEEEGKNFILFCMAMKEI